MATHDVREAFDSSFYDSITIILREVSVHSNARVQVTRTVPLSILAVVTAASPDDLARLPEGEHMNKAISVYSMSRIQGPSRDEVGIYYHPDQILWHGSLYVVNVLEDYSGYGRGFVHAVATSVQ